MDKFSELKATVPVNVKNREAVSAGFVTHDNTGGYFVIECQECGAVYPSQQADGGGQIADTGDYDDAICPHCGEESPEECENVGLAWNVQQAKITVLLAELEAKDKRIAELEVGHQEAAKQIASWRRIAKQNIEEREKDLVALDAERQKITGLEAIRADASQVFKEIGNELGCNPDNESIMMAIDDLKATQMTGPLKDVLKRNIELEAKLATPVRLPRTLWYEHDDLPHEIPVLEKKKVVAEIRAAGFKVEGDE
ncbi:hypothetical protein ACI2J7_01325 [Serratia bockelmannii]|uniref:hypothetical protein n=1 Tax=Serratia bockelmannii TaxID=2703793 RepID=UPI00384E3597